MTDDEVWIEHDTVGESRVSAAGQWHAHTRRAVETFRVSGTRVETAQVRALARIKGAAACVNADLGVIDADLACAVGNAAAAQVVEARHDQTEMGPWPRGAHTRQPRVGSQKTAWPGDAT